VVRQIFFNVLWSASQNSLGNTALETSITTKKKFCEKNCACIF
jgi:hypothetical protein